MNKRLNDEMLKRVKKLTAPVSMTILGNTFWLRVEHDNEFEPGRIFIQVCYYAPCTKTGESKSWHGRKWYLSRHMTDDEIIKTCYAAFKAAVEHEIMEGFKVGGVTLFNPHADFRALLTVSNVEVKRIGQSNK